MAKSGRITLARHGEPDIDRSVRLSAAEYGAFWERYENVGLKEGQGPPQHLIEAAREADVVLVSTRLRAIRSAMLLAEGAPFRQDVRLIEAPLPHPPFPDFIRLSPRNWGFFSRLWWWLFNHNRGQETRVEAAIRARVVAAELSTLADGGQNVLVCAHGYFNAMIGYQLRRLGWRRAWGRGWKYWSTRRYERR